MSPSLFECLEPFPISEKSPINPGPGLARRPNPDAFSVGGPNDLFLMIGEMVRSCRGSADVPRTTKTSTHTPTSREETAIHVDQPKSRATQTS
jgi:hypothetical protein